MDSPHLNLAQQYGVSQQLGLNLAPQLLQWLQILQAPTQRLHAMVRQELETNPALEADYARATDDGQPGVAEGEFGDDDFAGDSSFDADGVEDRMHALAEIDDDWCGGVGNAPADASDARDRDEWHQHVMDSIRARTSLQEYLLKQAACDGFAPEELPLAELAIGSLDSSGYLFVSVSELATMGGTTDECAERVLRRVQMMDPPGIAARDLRECLLLQMQHLNGSHELAKRIVRDYLVPAAQKNIGLIARELGADEESVRDALRFIGTLNPTPGQEFETGPVQYVAPDVIVVKRNGRYEIELADDALPRLNVSGFCRRLVDRRTVSGADCAYLRRKLRQAAFLIQGIRERGETLRKVAEHMVRAQREFLDGPPGQLRPLTMVKVGRLIGVHETTVGRAVANKYIRTPRGLFEMKHFFRKGYACRDGSGLTPELLKEVIAGLFQAEDPAAPLTDLQVAERLHKERGLRMARRTVAKYREELDIKSSKERMRV